MKASTIFALVAAAVVTAAPTNSWPEPENDSPPSVCSSGDQQQVCCNGGVANLGCLVQALGSTCDGSSYCCNTSQGPGSSVNLNLLNCLNL